MGESRGGCRVLVGKPEGQRPLERRKRSWEIVLSCIFRKWDVGDVDWIELAQYRDMWRALVNAVMDLRFP
jgi:hypothetical protein